MFDPSLRRAPGSDVDRHLAHGKLQPVLHPADINGQYSRHHSGSDRVDLLRRRAYQPAAREGRTQSHFPGDGMILSSIAVTNGIVAIKLVFGLG